MAVMFTGRPQWFRVLSVPLGLQSAWPIVCASIWCYKIQWEQPRLPEEVILRLHYTG